MKNSTHCITLVVLDTWAKYIRLQKRLARQSEDKHDIGHAVEFSDIGESCLNRKDGSKRVNMAQNTQQSLALQERAALIEMIIGIKDRTIIKELRHKKLGCDTNAKTKSNMLRQRDRLLMKKERQILLDSSLERGMMIKMR